MSKKWYKLYTDITSGSWSRINVWDNFFQRVYLEKMREPRCGPGSMIVLSGQGSRVNPLGIYGG